MDLIRAIPELNLYEDSSKIYTFADHQPPQFTGADADVKTSLLSEGCEVYGSVYNSTLGPDVIVEKGAVVQDSIIMGGCVIGENTQIERCIIDENSVIGSNTKIGLGENIPNKLKPRIYDTGITVIGEGSVIPDGIIIGKNCVIHGVTNVNHYVGMRLNSGETIELDTGIGGVV